MAPMLLDFANHKTSLFDEGDNRISSTSLLEIGKAIVEILKHFKATENKVVRTSEMVLTQDKLLEVHGRPWCFAL